MWWVQCDNDRPCRPCRTLDIPCTLERRIRRRGPPNKLAQALRREHQSRSSVPRQSSTHESSGDFSLAHSSNLTAESIGPLELVQELVDDYFSYLHALHPVPHQPSFRTAFEQRRDVQDGYFLALLASMVGALVAAYPRRARRRLKRMGDQHLFRSAVDFVIHCQNVATQARGSAYLEREGLNSNDAATSFCFLTMFGYTYRFPKGMLYFGECNNIVRCLMSQRSPNNLDATENASVDLVEEQMTLRLFWLIFVAIRSVDVSLAAAAPRMLIKSRSTKAFGSSLADVCINPPTPAHPYPPLPFEVDDAYIHATHIDPQPSNKLSYMAGFIANVKIYTNLDPVICMENSFGVDRIYDAEKQRSILFNGDKQVKHYISQLPPQLCIWHGPASRTPSTPASTFKRDRSDTTGSEDGTDTPIEHEDIYEIQKANIYVSYLSVRSYIIEKYYSLSEPLRPSRDSDSPSRAHAVTEVRQWIRTQREGIAADLLHVLSSIRPIHFEPNGASLTMKIRQIASTLLPEPDPAGSLESPSGGLMLEPDGRFAYYIRQFMEILVDLERGSKRNSNSQQQRDEDYNDDEDDEDDEDEDLRKWASMREHQRAFVHTGESIAASPGAARIAK